MLIAVKKDTREVVQKGLLKLTNIGLQYGNKIDPSFNTDNCEIIRLVGTPERIEQSVERDADGNPQVINKLIPAYTPPSIPTPWLSGAYKFIDNTFVPTELGSALIAEHIAKNNAELKQHFIDAVQDHLDDSAKEKGYDNILSACSYAAVANPFQAEGQAFLEWRSNVWSTCYTILAEVEAGTRTAPSAKQLITELPTLALP